MAEITRLGEQDFSKAEIEDKFVRDPNKTPYSSQRPPQDCPKCGNPIDGLYCRHCALLRKKLKEVWFTVCDEHKFFQDFLNTFESSNDDSNVVDMPQEPIVFNQDPDGIFCQRCTCESCGNDAHHGYNCPSKVPIISNPEPCHNQNVEEFPQTLPSFHLTCYFGDENSFAYDSTSDFVNDSSNVLNPPSQPPMYSYEFCGNDAHFSHDCPPQLPFIYNPEPFIYILVVKTVGGRMKLFNFDRLQVWELVDKPFGKMIIRLKWLWKNKKDEDQTVIHNKARPVAKSTQVFSNLSKKKFVDPDHPEKGLPSQVSSLWIEASSKGMNCTVMSSTEAEYVVLSGSCAQVMWMRTQLQDYGFNYKKYHCTVTLSQP
nr:ribonuclease H-like domain-containing protein [Tanacetum cinerariifolium]